MTDWIAVVDNEMATLKLASRILSNNGMRVSAMSSGKALLTFLKGETPDIILMDAVMPEMDGFETLARLRKQEEKNGSAQVPVLFLTDEGDTDAEKKSNENGKLGFVCKADLENVLLEKIQKILAENVDRPVDNHEGVEIDENADLKHLNRTLKDKADPNSALWVDKEEFKHMYKFFTRYIGSYKAHACKVLFNFSILRDIAGLEKDFQQMMMDFGQILKNLLRRSDVMVQSKDDQFLLLLPEVDEEHLEGVLDRIERAWNEYAYSDYVAIIYERETVAGDDSNTDGRRITEE